MSLLNFSLTDRKMNMIKQIMAPVTYNILDGTTTEHVFPAGEDINMTENPMPVVIIINGAGGNGKDTFVEAVGQSIAVFNVSSVDDVKDVGKIFIDKCNPVLNFMTVNPRKEYNEKSNAYRKFLSDIKKAWEEFCDGPTWAVIAKIDNLMQRQMIGLECHDLIFIHIREGVNIDKMKAIIEDRYGAICLTMLVTGLVNPESYDNDSDRNVENYTYDLKMINSPGDLQGFKERAALFGKRMAELNRYYGVELPKDETTPADVPEQPDEM